MQPNHAMQQSARVVTYMVTSTPVRILVAFTAAAVLIAASSSDQWPSLDCNSTFPPNASAESLRERFGAQNVTSSDVDVGEGVHELGTVLFADLPLQRLEVLWKDSVTQRNIRLVRVRGEATAWHTIHGLSIGTDLKTLENLNGVPFTLAGFDWDYSGTVTSWQAGLLADPSGVCNMTVRLSPKLQDNDPVMFAWHEQVIGDGDFSSNHPAMQELNPRIYSIELSY